MEQEYFEKTSRKADRWFVIAIVTALLFGITFSLYAVLNWILFCLSAYAFFMSYYLLPQRPKIFERRSQPQFGKAQRANDTSPQATAEKAKRAAIIIVAGIFGMFIFILMIGLFVGEDAPAPEEYEQQYADMSQMTSAELVQKGNDFFGQNEYDSADKYYDAALKVDNSNGEAVYGKGIVCYQTERMEEANRYFRDAYDKGFRFGWLSWALADQYEKEGQSQRALALYKESVQLDSTMTDSYSRLAELDPSNRQKYLDLAKKYGQN